MRGLVVSGMYLIVLMLFSTRVSRADTWVLLFYAALLSGMYLYMLRARWSPPTIGLLLAGTVLFRLAVSTGLPWLTDDFYRFIWDGQLIHADIHPFSVTPEQTGLRNALFQALNSKGYFSVYPTVCQAIFYVGAFGKSHLASVSIMRAFLLVGEVVTVYSLARRFGKRTAWWYASNPLAIIEVCGNLHFEGLAVCFLTLMMYQLWQAEQQSKGLIQAGMAYALAIATKINPLLLAPILVARMPNRSRIGFALTTVFCTLLMFTPLLLKLPYLYNMLSSLNLYFRDFSINASVYYLLNHVYYAFTADNGVTTIGPSLSCITVMIIAYLAWRVFNKKLAVADAALMALMTYLFLSTTVHPWYILLPFGMSFWASHQKWKLIALVWTLCVFLSYSHYMHGIYSERYLFTLVEYACLIAAWQYGTRCKWLLLSSVQEKAPTTKQ
jgi:alpha-1,6-mannosyltransferase